MHSLKTCDLVLGRPRQLQHNPTSFSTTPATYFVDRRKICTVSQGVLLEGATVVVDHLGESLVKGSRPIPTRHSAIQRLSRDSTCYLLRVHVVAFDFCFLGPEKKGFASQLNRIREISSMFLPSTTRLLFGLRRWAASKRCPIRTPKEPPRYREEISMSCPNSSQALADTQHGYGLTKIVDVFASKVNAAKKDRPRMMNRERSIAG